MLTTTPPKPDYFLRNFGIHILTDISIFGLIENIIIFTNFQLFRGNQLIFYLTILSFFSFQNVRHIIRHEIPVVHRRLD